MSKRQRRLTPQDIAKDRLLVATALLAALNSEFACHQKVPANKKIPKLIRAADGAMLYEFEYEWVLWNEDLELDEETLSGPSILPSTKPGEFEENLYDQISGAQEEAEKNIARETFESYNQSEDYYQKLSAGILNFIKQLKATFEVDGVFTAALTGANILIPEETPLKEFVSSCDDQELISFLNDISPAEKPTSQPFAERPKHIPLRPSRLRNVITLRDGKMVEESGRD